MSGTSLRIGNTAAPTADGKRYDWKLYVQGATQYVESVVIKLHPTFKDPVRTRDVPPFEFPGRGWGTFDIPVLLQWKGGSSSRTTWELQFDAPDASCEVAVPPKVLEAMQAQAAAPATRDADEEATHSDLLGTRGSAVPDSSDEIEAAAPEDGPGEAEGAPPAEPPELLRDTSTGTSDDDPSRASICERLRQTPFLEHTHPLFALGRGYEGPQKPPKVTWRSDKPPRSDHACPKWLTATEFEDLPEVRTAKIKQLARLVRLSRKTVAYTGAGISAAVIGQAARSGQNTVGWKNNTRAAPPTFTHYALGFLGREGLLHGWVQQNHDGLPQKAGFPQERINEIHGSWYDPSNPVVKYSGSLHDRSYPWMREDAQTADLCLVLGTSLGGLNADQVATSTAERSLYPSAPPPGVVGPGAWLRARPPGKSAIYKGLVVGMRDGVPLVRFQATSAATADDSEEEDASLCEPVALAKDQKYSLLPSVGGGLGTVMLNLQQTPHDGKMTLRLFGKSDDLMRLLLPELGFSLEIVKPPRWPTTNRGLVPYDAEGKRIAAGGRRMWLDLRKGQEVRITPGHNIQGARQPAYMHIGAKQAIKVDGVTREPAVGNGVVASRSDETASYVLQIEGVQMRLGVWWLECAMRGGVDVLPIVNRKPVFE